jgi:hypothetical protein
LKAGSLADNWLRSRAIDGFFFCRSKVYFLVISLLGRLIFAWLSPVSLVMSAIRSLCSAIIRAIGQRIMAVSLLWQGITVRYASKKIAPSSCL